MCSPPDANNSNDPISEKKLIKDEGQYSTQKMLLGCNFDGLTNTMWLELAKREKLLTILKGWIRLGTRGAAGIIFKEFELVATKAFTCIPAGVGLFLSCNWILKFRPAFVYLHKNCKVLNAIKGCHSLLCKSTLVPTQCCKLMCGWPNYIGIVGVSSYGVGGVIFGELSACTPTVFRRQLSDKICTNLKTSQNQMGTISNSDLEMPSLLMLWLAIKGVCVPLQEK
jgi:hypothetical protein